MDQWDITENPEIDPQNEPNWFLTKVQKQFKGRQIFEQMVLEGIHRHYST